MKVYVGGKRVKLDPTLVIGSGGEADVYDLGGGAALKLFKTPQHPDFAASASAQQQVADRLAEHQDKLAEFPTGLPAQVVAPVELARDRSRGGRIVGYTMRKIEGAEPLQRFAEPRFRRLRRCGNLAVAVLRDLRATVEAVHDAGVVVGDFNDLNVLVQNTRAYLIDSDSFQFGRYLCGLFTERFVDPAHCAAGELPLALAAPHDRGSDWYAFAVVAFRSLLCADPYGGVHRPTRGAALTPGQRKHSRTWILAPEVVYPKPAIRAAALPDELLAYFEGVFCRDQRDPLPTALLDGLRWTHCLSCDREHARLTCPSCNAGRRSPSRAPSPARVVIRGAVTAEHVVRTDGPLLDVRVDAGDVVWLAWDGHSLVNQRGSRLAQIGPAPGRELKVWGDGALVIDGAFVRAVGPTPGELAVLTDVVPQAAAGASVAAAGKRVFWAGSGAVYKYEPGSLGEQVIGRSLAGHTRLWLGSELGFAWYRAGAMAVGLLFEHRRPGAIDVLDLPPIRGHLLSVDCAVGATGVWLSTVERIGGREFGRCALIDRSGRVVARAEGAIEDVAWLACTGGACAAGEHLFVPTDDGIVRVENFAGDLAVTRVFTDTASFVDSSSQLLVARSGLLAVSRSSIVRLSLT